ncbi:aminopeptidase P N-terminal domain-containing protein [Burkholderia thailandensis]|uniref:aminopeptidase P N-terminal domain-containing protein n=1 Tax=Burkholderia thailandensis TaxID=57975 RepID=UPI002D785F82|nr:aminopeptidase P N-terminal domain-containing protein [Burkholderia thailandensis]WRS69942.1 aminopeptidase P N-terminal domain-containing protein [Burkholderia thailandensis]
MFDANVYRSRRESLARKMGSGLALMLGNNDVPINFAHNVYRYQQDATFLYFFGVSRPGLAVLADFDSNEFVAFGDERTNEESLWLGETESLRNEFVRVGVERIEPFANLRDAVAHAAAAGRTIHFLPPYRADTVSHLAHLLDCKNVEVMQRASRSLVDAVLSLREIKGPEEIDQIEQALVLTAQMHRVAMHTARPGVREREVVAEMRRVLDQNGVPEAYAPIFTRRGDILHNGRHDSRLEKGDLVVNDYGAASPAGYASDITRTIPVGGRFEGLQRDLYQLLVEVQKAGVAEMRPGVPFLHAHTTAAIRMVDGMKGLGFFSGDSDDIVSTGAYALCFPHGLGHQMGLDVHDMESFGEDLVGYDEEFRRSKIFGLASLRLAKRLKKGMVTTVEPGIYFIPNLIRSWSAERRHASFINYEAFAACTRMGGMRVEDNVVVTEDGAMALGPAIPKSVSEIESLMEA